MAKASAASLGVLRPDFARMEPPSDISEAEMAVWRSVVATKPAGWFTKDVAPLLKAYCRGAVSADLIAEQVNAFDPTWLATDEGLKRYERLTKMARDQALSLANLATKMRLTQQSRYTPQAAATASKAAASSKPWEKVG